MISERFKELIKPILKEVYAEGYNAGQDDTSRRMYQLYIMGYENGATDAYTRLGAIEIPEITEKEFEEARV